MLAVRTVSKETLEYADVPDPEPASGQAVVQIEHATLCGTDLHIWEDDYTSELPLIQGHELAGTVVEVADGVTRVSVGDRVAVDPLISCGECRACRMGRANVCPDLVVFGCYCDGGFVERLAVDAGQLHPVPAELPTDLAAAAEPTSISMQAVVRGRATADDVALVLGAGPIGLLAALALHDLGAKTIVADVVADRLELAREFGADETILVDPAEPFPGASGSETIDRLTDGEGPSLVIEATGVPASLENALRAVAAAGRVVQVGISTRPTGFPLSLLAFKEIDLMGSRNSTGLMPEALALIGRHPDTVRRLLTHRFPISRLSDAFETMRDRTQRVGKILIDLPAGEAGSTAAAGEGAGGEGAGEAASGAASEEAEA